jgi:hypothetical protein
LCANYQLRCILGDAIVSELLHSINSVLRRCGDQLSDTVDARKRVKRTCCRVVSVATSEPDYLFNLHLTALALVAKTIMSMRRKSTMLRVRLFRSIVWAVAGGRMTLPATERFN